MMREFGTRSTLYHSYDNVDVLAIVASHSTLFLRTHSPAKEREGSFQ
jgi:hypothetical protein